MYNIFLEETVYDYTDCMITKINYYLVKDGGAFCYRGWFPCRPKPLGL